MAHQIFVNLPVKDLKRSKAFFESLGYSFNPQFTDDKAGCLVIDKGQGIYAMLVTEPFFKTFIPNHEIADGFKTKEVLIALSCDSKEQVDDILGKAVSAGGREFERNMPEGTPDWMYGKAFEDLDGHVWEVLWMDPAHIQ